MWAASTPPPPERRRAALVALLLVPVLLTGLAAGPLGLLKDADRPPPPLVEHSHVLEPDGDTAQRLIPAPTDPQTGPSASDLPVPPVPTTNSLAPAPVPAEPAAAPLATPPPPPDPAAAALAGLVDARLADPRLAGTTVGLSVWVDGLGEVAQPSTPWWPPSPPTARNPADTRCAADRGAHPQTTPHKSRSR